MDSRRYPEINIVTALPGKQGRFTEEQDFFR